MKKKGIILVAVLILVLVLINISLFLIFRLPILQTGRIVDGTIIANSAACSDTDGGVFSTAKGTVNTTSAIYIDFCYNTKTVYEFYCNTTTTPSSASATLISCQGGDSCINGECTSFSPIICS